MEDSTEILKESLGGQMIHGQVRVSVGSPWQDNTWSCEGEAWAIMKNSRCQKWQKCGISTEDKSQAVGRAGPREKQFGLQPSRPSGWYFKWATTINAFRVVFSEPVRASILTVCALNTRHGATGFHVCFEVFWFHFGPILLCSFLVLIFGTGMLIVCHCIMEAHNFFWFSRETQPRLCLVSKEILNLGSRKML